MREHGPARCRPCVAVSRKHGNAHCAPGPSPRVRAFPARLGWAQPKRATDRGRAPAAADGRQCRRQEMLRLRVRAGLMGRACGARGGSTPCLGAASAESGRPYRQRRQPASCRAAAVSCTTAARSRTVMVTASIHSAARRSALCPRREQAMAPRAQVHACDLTILRCMCMCVCVCVCVCVLLCLVATCALLATGSTALDIMPASKKATPVINPSHDAASMVVCQSVPAHASTLLAATWTWPAP